MKRIIPYVLSVGLSYIGGCLPPTYTSEQFARLHPDVKKMEEVNGGADVWAGEKGYVVDIATDTFGGEGNQSGDGNKIEGSSIDTPIMDVPEVLAPYQPDEHCVALFHFEPPLEWYDSCKNLKLNNYATKEVTSMQGFGKARAFNGDAYIELPDNSLLKVKKELTLEALVKPDLKKDSFKGDFGNIITKAEGGADSYSGYSLIVGNGYVSGALALNGGEFHAVTVPYDFPTDQFTHVALTYDGSSIRLYVNRDLKDQEKASGEIFYKAGKSVFMGWNPYSNGFVGSIDEVRISDVARDF